MLKQHKLDIASNLIYGLTIMVGAFVVLGIANLNNLVGLINGSSHDASAFFAEVGSTVFQRITRFLDKLPQGETIVTFLFWLLVGTVVYGLVLVAVDFTYTVKYERSLLTEYQYPTYANKASVVRRLLLMWILVAGFALTLLFMTLILLFFTFPVSRAVFMNAFYNSGSTQSWFYTIEAVLLLGVNCQIVAWLTRVFMRSRGALN